MRRRWWILAAFLVALLATAVWRYGFNPLDPREIANPPPPDPPEPAVLDEVVSVAVVQRPLREVLAELSQRHGVEIEIDLTAFQQAGVQPDHQVTLAIEGVRLRTVLELLARSVHHEGILVDRDGALLITMRSHWYAVQDNYVTRIHRLDPLLTDDGAIDEAALADAIDDVVAPSTWRSSRGLGKLERMPGAFAVTQTPQAHREIAALLDGLAQLAREPDRVEPHNLSAPFGPARARILKALAQPVDLKCKGTPCFDFYPDLSERYDIPIWIDPHPFPPPWSASFGMMPRIRRDFSNMTLGAVLHNAADYAYFRPYLDDDVIKLGGFAPHSIVLYPVADVLAVTGDNSPAALVNVVRSLVDRVPLFVPQPAASLPSGVHVVGDTFIVSTDLATHASVERLLADLRRALRPGAIPPPTPTARERREREIEALLSQRCSLHFERVQAKVVVRELMEPLDVKLNYFRYYDDVISVDADDVPLETALRWMCANDDWGGASVWHEQIDFSFTPPTSRCYPLPDSLSSGQREDLVAIVRGAVPDHHGNRWWSIDRVGNVLVVHDRRDAHRAVESLLSAIEAGMNNPPDAWSLDAVPPADDLTWSCLAALETVASVDLLDVASAEEFVRRASDRYGTPLILVSAPDAPPAAVLGAEGVDLFDSIQQFTRLRALTRSSFERDTVGAQLELLCSLCGVRCEIRDGAIWLIPATAAAVATPAAVSLPLLVRIYAIGDLGQLQSPAATEKDVNAAIAGSGRGTGNTPRVDRFGQLLVVKADWNSHRRVMALLDGLRVAAVK